MWVGVFICSRNVAKGISFPEELPQERARFLCPKKSKESFPVSPSSAGKRGVSGGRLRRKRGTLFEPITLAYQHFLMKKIRGGGLARPGGLLIAYGKWQ